MENQQKKIVVIGAGYAGMLATVRLAGKLHRGHQAASITLVNASDFFVERVRLHEFAAEYEVIERPIEKALRGTGVTFVRGTVTRVDTSRRELTVESEAGVVRLNYDNLLYALGSTIDTSSVPGVRDYAYTLTPAGPMSAAELRRHLPALGRTGGRLVVVGGGATGIEAAAQFASSYPKLEVHLLTRGALGRVFGEHISGYMRQSLQRQGVTIHEHTAVTEVGPDEVQTAGGSIPYDICLWAGGFTALPLAKESGISVNERGQILIDPFMRSISHPEIYAIGDAADPVDDPGAKVRMAAGTAVFMGAHGADCLAATLQGHTPKPFSFSYLGQGVALGPHDAIGFSNYPDDVPHAPYVTGRPGSVVRGFFVRFLANVANFERRLPGAFFWPGKGRYAAALRTRQQAQVEPVR